MRRGRRATRPAPRRRASSGSRASRRAPSASASGSPGGTSSALSPSTSSSRAPGVSAVTSGVPHASAWNALFGITRRAFADVPKTPSAQPLRARAPGSCSYGHPRDPLDVRRPRGEQALELAAPDDRGAAARGRAAPRRGSSPDRAAGSACRRRAAARSAPRPGRTAAPRRRRGTRRPARAGCPASSARKSAFASVSATTRSAARSARRSSARERARRRASPAGSGPGRSTSVSNSETSALKTTGAPACRPSRGGQVEVARIADDARRRTRRAARRARSRACARASRDGRLAPAPHLCSASSHTGSWRSTTSTPARRRHEITCALRG